MVKAIIGANWGDEGKGKITDMLANDADIVVRFQGGANAGHTIINNYGRFALHTLPSGVFNKNVVSIIGSGVALDVDRFIEEIHNLENNNVPIPKILISDRTQIVMPYHKLFDLYEEERLKGKSFGSTKSGIAPFYSDKYSKIGFTVSELDFDDYLKEHLKNVIEIKNSILHNFYHKDILNFNELYEKLINYKNKLKPYICDTTKYLRNAINENKNILLEGQLGTLKDTDYGIYPMVTSSHTIAGFASIGCGIPPYYIKDIIGVTKAYSSAVGAGAFVSEIFGDEAEELRKRGGDKGEYGATTGRPRRVGWYDLVASKYGVNMPGCTEVALTVIDALHYLDEIKICVAYDINGEICYDFPTTQYLNIAKPVYKSFKGWKSDIRGIKNYNDLPKECREYIEFIENGLKVPITMISNGPDRNDIIYKK